MNSIQLFLYSALVSLLMVNCQSKSKSTGYANTGYFNEASYGAFEYVDIISNLESDRFAVEESKATFDFENQMKLKKESLGRIDQQIIYNASIRIECKIVDSIPDELQNLAIKNKGYLSSKSSGHVTMRIPKDQLDSVIESLGDIGKIVRKEIYANDVTAAYTDLGIRLENAEKARLTYLALLEQSANVSEALLVEKELERLNVKIELLKGQYNAMIDQIVYATIDVTIQEKTKLGVLGFVGKGLYSGVKWLFVRN